MSKAPKLRFKEFSGELESKKIASIFDRVINKVDVIEEEYYEQIGIRSHGKGIFYKEPVTGKELGNKRVFWVEPNVFVVNIVFAWEQAIARTTQNEVGMIASHRFPMYKPKENILDLDYITQLFKTPKGKFLLGLASPGGAGRNKTLGQKEFDDLDIILPPYEEQKKIASFISLIDKKVVKQSEKVEVLKDYKRGMMQKIFSRELKFKDDYGRDYKEWKKIRLSQILKERKTYSQKNKGLEHVTLSKDGIYEKGERYDRDFLVTTDDKKYKITRLGDICYNPANLKFGVICINNYGDAIFSPIYVTFEVKSGIDSEYIGLYLSRWDFINRVRKYEEGTVYERMAVKPEDFLKFEIELPSIEEQIKIKTFINKIDKKIKYEQAQLDSLNEYKKGLLQQMFV